MDRKVAIPKGTVVLTCGHSPLEKILVDPQAEEGSDTVLLCKGCFATFVTDGELHIHGDQFEIHEDIFADKEDWS